MKIRSSFTSSSEEDIRQMGGYFFPYLENAIEMGIGTWFSVKTFSIAINEIHDLVDVVRNNSNVLAFVKGGNLVSIDGDFKFSDMGLMLHSGDIRYSRMNAIGSIHAVHNMRGNYGSFELMTRAENSQSATKLALRQFPSESVVDLFTQSADMVGAKMEKRAGTIARPVRVATSASDMGLSRFKVMVLPATPKLDGWGLVNGKLLDAGIIKIRTPEWMPEQRAQAIRWFDRQMVYNSRVVGDLEFVDATGKPILGLEGHLKFQVSRDDDMPDDIAFITSMAEVKAEMHPVEGGCGWSVAIFDPQSKKDAFEDQQTVTNNPFLLSIPDTRYRVTDEAKKMIVKLTKGEMMSSVDELAKAEFDKRFPWEGETFNRMLRWRTSAWALYGMSYMDSKWLFEQLGRQWTQTLNWGSVHWSKTLKVNIPCAVRAQVISSKAANLHSQVNMQPERGTPEWSSLLGLMVVHEDDWEEIVIPSHGGCDQDDFFVIRWVTIDGEKKILFTRNPNNRGEYTVWNYKEGDFFPTHTTSKGEEISFPEITKKRWPKQILKALEDGDTEYLMLPTETDPNATLEDDRMAVLAEQQNILSRIYESGKGVDASLVRRLGVDGIPADHNGIIHRGKQVMAKVIEDYLAVVYDYSASLEIPSYLVELGNNEMLGQAVNLLKKSRAALYYADHTHHETDQAHRAAVIQAQDDVLLPAFANTDDRAVRARFAVALWYASRVTPTSTSKRITDQAIFGTGVFDYLLDGLLYLGVAHKPGYVSVKYMGNHRWNVICRSCNTEYQDLGLQGLIAYWNNDRVCKTCRNK